MNKAVPILLLLSSTLAYADTVLNLYRPYAESTKHVPIIIESTQKGNCTEQSNLIKREDAWRCVSDNHRIYDPCFSKPFGSLKSVICPESPWVGQSVKLELNKPLKEQNMESLDMSHTLPWAVELTNGEHCLATLPQPSNNGPIQYTCSKDISLIGDAHRCSPVWTILKQEGSVLSSVEIATAWF